MTTIRLAPGDTSKSVDFVIYKDTGKLNTAAVYNTSGLAARYTRDNGTPVAITLATLASETAAYASGGFIKRSSGAFRLDIPDAALASGASKVVISIDEATDINADPVTIQLTAADSRVVTALPNAAPGGANGLVILDSGTVTKFSYLDYLLALVGRTGTCQSGSTGSTIKLDAGASTVNNAYVGWSVKLTGGTGAGQYGTIKIYNGTTKVADILTPNSGTWAVTPDATTTFQLIPTPILTPSVFTADAFNGQSIGNINGIGGEDPGDYLFAALSGLAVTLTSAERDTLAGVIDARLLSAGDATDLIAGIISRIGNTNIDQATLVAAIKSALFEAGSIANKLVVDGNGRVVASSVVGSVGSIPNVTLAASQPNYAPAKASDVSPTISFSPTINPTTLDSTERTAIATAVTSSTSFTNLASGVAATKTAAEAAQAAAEAIVPPTPPDGLVQTITLTNAGNGLAIQGASIRYSQAGVTKDTAVTDAEGLATVAVLAGTYTRSVIAAGFDALADVVIVAADADLDIELTVATTGASANVGPGLAN